MVSLYGIPKNNNSVYTGHSLKLICKCDRRKGRLYYDFQSKKFIHKGGCYPHFICSYVVKMRFIAWLKKNKELMQEVKGSSH